MIQSKYLQEIYETVLARDPNEVEFRQAIFEVLESLDCVIAAHPEYQQHGIIERFIEPERIISFRVPWVNDKGELRVNRGFRVQYNSAIGPYKGGLRFHPTVNQSVMKFLAFEQTLKNSLTTLPMGGGKGGSDFDPKEKSDGEVMRFCQSFMNELYRHIGQFTDTPAGDIGVGAREIGYLYGQYKRIVDRFEGGVLTGKPIVFGGSLGRTEATGYGLCYFVQEMLAQMCGDSFAGKTVVISGSGNVAIFACQKATELGATVVAMSDSDGYIYDKNGINLDIVKQIKLQSRGRIKEYQNHVKSSQYLPNRREIWTVPCDIALPCATQGEIHEKDAKIMIEQGVRVVAEGANMPTSLAATKLLQDAGVLFAPSKAANAGGVAVSGLEMSQNSLRLNWSAQEVDTRLKVIMEGIFHNASQAAQQCGKEGNLVIGANIAGFMKVADAMLAQGVV